MPVEYAQFCDDFYLNMRLASQMALPNSRDTLLHFFEQVQKAYPTMTRFRKTDASDHSLEEDRANNRYRWLSVEAQRLAAGHVNPETVEDAVKLHQLVLELAPYQLSISPVEIEYLDVLFGFDLEFKGNHDEIIAETIFQDSPLTCLLEEEGARPVDFQPSAIVALSEDCRLQARVDLVTRTNSYQVRTGDYGNDVISVYLIVRRYWGDRPRKALGEIFQELVDRGEKLAHSYVLPRIVKPISAAIGSR
jgi:hypothetical protein